MNLQTTRSAVGLCNATLEREKPEKKTHLAVADGTITVPRNYPTSDCETRFAPGFFAFLQWRMIKKFEDSGYKIC